MKTEYRVYFTTDAYNNYLVTRVDTDETGSVEYRELGFETLEQALTFINNKGYTTFGVRIV